MEYRNDNTAYITGVAMGDGNLSNPNRRAVRLRITCDNKYPLLQVRIAESLSKLFPENKIGIYKRPSNCTDVSVYSNNLERILEWTASGGSKEMQKIRVPNWIFREKRFIRVCLKGLFETDGSIYRDRQYTFANFTTIIYGLALDVHLMTYLCGYTSHIQNALQPNGKRRFTVRVSKDALKFINEIGIEKK